MLLWEDIQLLFKVFPFLAMSTSSRQKFSLFVVWHIYGIAFLLVFLF